MSLKGEGTISGRVSGSSSTDMPNPCPKHELLFGFQRLSAPENKCSDIYIDECKIDPCAVPTGTHNLAINSNHSMLEQLAAADLPGPEFDTLVERVWDTEVKVEAIIKFLGLDRCKDTMVGDNLTPGISGGEKKRLTSAEMLVGPKRVLLMDEISTGLDSATVFAVVKWLALATKSMRWVS